MILDVVRPGNQVAALQALGTRLHRLVTSFNEAKAFYETMDVVTQTVLDLSCSEDVSSVLGKPDEDPLTEGEKGALMERIISGDAPASTQEATSRVEPAYIVTTTRLIRQLEQEVHGIEYYQRSGTDRQRRTETARNSLIGQVAAAFQKCFNRTPFEAPVKTMEDEPAPDAQECRLRLLRCIRLVLDNVKIKCPADKALLELIPDSLKQPAVGSG